MPQDKSKSVFQPVERESPVIQILGFDLNLQCIEASHDDHLNFTGLKGSFLLGRRLQDLLIPETSKAIILKHFNQCAAKNWPVKFDKVLEDIPLRPRISTTLIPQTENDEVTGIQAICSVEGFMERRPERTWFKDVFGFASSGVMLVDETGMIQELNKSTLFWSNSSIGTSCLEELDEESSVVFAMAIKRALSDKKTLFLERTFQQNGETSWFEVAFVPCVFLQEGVNIVFREISEFKSHQDDLQDQISIAEYVFDNMPEAVLIFDEQGNTRFANKKALQLFDAELVNFEHLNKDQHGVWQIVGHSEPLTNPGILVAKAMEGEIFTDVEIWRNKGGEETPFAVSAFPIILRNDIFKGVAWMLRDISNSVNARQRLEDANQNLDHFVQATAHDLKSPVTNMKNLFSLMERTKDDNKKKVFLSRIEEAVVKLDDLLGGLMELVDAQKNNELQIEPLRFDHIFQFIQSELEEQIKDANASVNVDFSKASSIVYNKAYLRSIFHNMLTNSLKYSREGVAPVISISSKMKGDFVCLEFKDNGIGIDMERFEGELFKPFRRLTSQGTGKGIGLNLVKGFVEKNGGKIEVTSKKGQGTTFTMFLKPYNNNEVQMSIL